MRGKTKPRSRLSKRRLKPNRHVKNLPLRPPAKAGRQNQKPLPRKSVRRGMKKRPSQQRALVVGDETTRNGNPSVVDPQLVWLRLDPSKPLGRFPR
jgi:hypothetical protein